MRIGYIILCRYGSTRLPGKILKEIKNKPLIQYIYERVRRVASHRDIIVATGNDPANLPIIEYCKKMNIRYFVGEQDNVSKRFLDCAERNRFDFAVRINGDNLFVSPQIIQEMLPIVKTDLYDFISNVKGRSFPTGMSVEFLRTSFYYNLIKMFNNSDYFEHVTLYLYEHKNEGRQYHFYNSICPNAKGRKFAVDTRDDFKFAEKLLSKITDYHTNYDICDWIKMDE